MWEEFKKIFRRFFGLSDDLIISHPVTGHELTGCPQCDGIEDDPPSLPVKHYVVGFLFDPKCHTVVLLRKNKGPDCVAGKWNGVGGKVEEDEDSDQAMTREWDEETIGLDTSPEWKLFARLSGYGFTVDFFCATLHLHEFINIRGREEEDVEVFDIFALPDVVPNVKWLIPMAQSMLSGEETASMFYIQEIGTNQENL